MGRKPPLTLRDLGHLCAFALGLVTQRQQGSCLADV
jgi:hypothetical protein